MYNVLCIHGFINKSLKKKLLSYILICVTGRQMNHVELKALKRRSSSSWIFQGEQLIIRGLCFGLRSPGLTLPPPSGGQIISERQFSTIRPRMHKHPLPLSPEINLLRGRTPESFFMSRSFPIKSPQNNITGGQQRVKNT